MPDTSLSAVTVDAYILLQSLQKREYGTTLSQPQEQSARIFTTYKGESLSTLNRQRSRSQATTRKFGKVG